MYPELFQYRTIPLETKVLRFRATTRHFRAGRWYPSLRPLRKCLSREKGGGKKGSGDVFPLGCLPLIPREEVARMSERQNPWSAFKKENSLVRMKKSPVGLVKKN